MSRFQTHTSAERRAVRRDTSGLRSIVCDSVLRCAVTPLRKLGTPLRKLGPPLITLVVITLALSACASIPGWVPLSPNHIPSSLDADQVPGAITKANDALSRDDTATAMDWMRAASKATGLPVETRQEVQALLEKASQRRIDVLSHDEDGADALADMVELDLPREIAVEAGLASAELYLKQDEGVDAYRVLKLLDTKFPLHFERQRAADIMCDVGLVAIQDGPGFLGFFTHRDEGIAILEYVILNAPWAKRGDEAYRSLSQRYEYDGEWDLSVQRAQQLVLNHPGSPLRVQAQAQVPHLRLLSIKSPEYDRDAIYQARGELEEWLTMFSGTVLEPKVRIDLGDALRRLSDNDMIVSHFYERVDNPFGAHRHAERALEEAKDAGDEVRMKDIQTWLDGLPPAPPPAIPNTAVPVAIPATPAPAQPAPPGAKP